MLHALSYYLRHLLKSVHLHGIHSPFVFQWQHRCLYGRTPANQLVQLKAYRDGLKNDGTTLIIKDYGAGSKKFTSEQRAIKDILKVNCTTSKRAALLSRLCDFLDVKRALELGTSLGVGTHALGLNGAAVTSIEASKSIYNFTKEKLKAHKNIQVVHGTFQAFLNQELSVKPKDTYDLIFLDGHHDGAATVSYFERLLPYAHHDTIFIMDDIYWSVDMTRVWKTLQKHPKVTASVDCFYWGFLFLRTEQLQQSFYIKL